MSEIIQFLQQAPEESAYYALASVLGLLSILFMLRRMRKSATRRRIKRALKSFGGQVVENITLSDGVEGNVQIDFCIYTRGRVLVLKIQDYPGILFGGEKIEQWTQVFEGKSYKFTNPLYYNRVCVQAVRDQLPGAKVFGRVVFTNNGEFPKGIPEGVSMLDCLLDDARVFARAPVDKDASLDVWQDFVGSLGSSSQTIVYKMQSA
ncbi:MAG: NERD domain-containing protein [Gammaproteobacteria bacterium]|nr:NERD domain-containing protein [Gammaproteobacteria bacterium]